jgi:predicted permease
MTIQRTAWFSGLGRDVRYAVRVLRRSPAFTLTAMATLAVALGANTAVFGAVHRVLLAALPVDAPERLFALSRDAGGGRQAPTFSHVFCRELQEPNTLIAGALCRGGGERLTVEGPGGAEPAMGELVSGTYFEVLGVRPQHGRLITPADAQPGGAAVAVLSHRYWLRRFGGDPSIVGAPIRLNAKTVTVIGVTPPGFDGLDPGQTVDIRLPFTMQANVRNAPSTLGRAWAFEQNIVVRLRDGVDAAAAEQHLAARLTHHLRLYGLETPAPETRGSLVRLRPAGGGFGLTRQRYATALLALMGVTGAVFLIACANLAGLVAARLSARRHEIATRLALGAGRVRLLRHLLVESLVLSIGGSVLGLVVAALCARGFARFAASGPVQLAPQPGQIDLVFHLAAAGVAALLFGVGPALRAHRRDVGPTRGRAEIGPRASVRVWLLGVQTALSVSVLVAAGLFVRTLHTLTQLDVGFAADSLLVLSLDPKNAGRSDADVAPYYRAVHDRLASLPGVTSVSFSTVRVVANESWTDPVTVEGGAPSSAKLVAARDAIGPGFFRTLGIPLVAGREFTSADDGRAPRVAIVNESFARFHFGSASPLGRRIGSDNPTHTIVGVARDSRIVNVRDVPPRAWYIPYEQRERLKHLNVYVRTGGDPSALIGAVRAAIAAVDPAVAVYRLQTQTAQIDEVLATERLSATLGAAFAIVAAALASLGLYGLLAFFVSERRREIALRMALGARTSGLVWTVARDIALAVGAGLGGGVTIAALAGRWIEATLYGVSGRDIPTLAGAVIVMGAMCALAALIPAWRAARVDPALLLRD